MEICEDCSEFFENEKPSSYSSKGYCDWYKTYYYPGDKGCSHFRPRCYIVTMLDELLEHPDNSIVLNTFNNFRKKELKNNIKYFQINFEYDIVGPKIARSIKEENDKKFMKKIYENRVKPIAKMINEIKYMMAVYNYQNLFMELKNYYGYNDLQTCIPDYSNINTNSVKILTKIRNKGYC